jgi:hypothetical protein
LKCSGTTRLLLLLDVSSTCSTATGAPASQATEFWGAAGHSSTTNTNNTITASSSNAAAPRPLLLCLLLLLSGAAWVLLLLLLLQRLPEMRGLGPHRHLTWSQCPTCTGPHDVIRPRTRTGPTTQ